MPTKLQHSEHVLEAKLIEEDFEDEAEKNKMHGEDDVSAAETEDDDDVW